MRRAVLPVGLPHAHCPVTGDLPQIDMGGDPGDSSVKVSGVWFGGRSRSQVTVRRLNQGPSADGMTPESVTATGYFANLPSAQLGTHWFSRSVPCPAAAVAVQADQVRPSTLTPSSAHASTMDDGSLLSVNGSALAQSATTPTAAAAAGEVGAAAGDAADVGGLAVAAGLAVAGGEDAGTAGEAEDWAGDAACPVGEAVAAGVEPDAAEPPWFALHPATAAPSAAQSRSLLTVWLT
ncbi:MAG TPA: hypothetical protein VGG54_28840 [Trebonia sp.]